jgi:hypothetical protein
MSPSRHVLPLITGVMAIGAVSGATLAVAADPVPAEDPSAPPDTADAEDAGGEDAVVAASMPVAFVEVSGGTSGALRTMGEARTTWRYGRARGASVDEATNRLRVSGAGRMLDGSPHGLSAGFSVALLVPALRVGTYAGGALVGAAAWARQDAAARTPDIEWDATGPDAGLATVVVTLTSIAETSHSSERRGGVTVDVTDFRVHGSIEAALPCTRSLASLRQSCRTETIRGTF